MHEPRPKRKSSSGVARAVSLLQKKPRNKKQPLQVEEVQAVACVVCNKTAEVTVKCSICERPLHRLCSNDVFSSLRIHEGAAQLEDLGDRSFCSRECYHTYHPMTQIDDGSSQNRPTQRQLLWRDQVEDRESLSGTTSDVVPPPELPPESSTAHEVMPPPVGSDDWIMAEMVSFCPKDEDWMDKKVYQAVGPTMLNGKVTQTRFIKPKNNDPPIKQYMVTS